MRRRIILEIEILESRQALSDVGGSTLYIPPPPSGTAVIDPTFIPATTTGATLQVFVTALGPAVNGSVSTIAVNYVGGVVMPGGAPLALEVGGQVYNIDSTVYTASGMQLTVLSSISTSGISVGSSALVLFGPVTPPPPVTTAPTQPPMTAEEMAQMAAQIMAAATPPPVVSSPPPVAASPPTAPPMTPEEIARMAAQIMAAAMATTATPAVNSDSTTTTGTPASYVSPPMVMPPPGVVPPVDPTIMPFAQ